MNMNVPLTIDNLLHRLQRLADSVSIEGLDIAASPALVREYRSQLGIVSDSIHNLQASIGAKDQDYTRITALSTATWATKELLILLNRAEPIQRQHFADLIGQVLRAIRALQQRCSSTQPGDRVINASHLFQSRLYRRHAGSSGAVTERVSTHTVQALESIQQERMESRITLRERVVGQATDPEGDSHLLPLAVILEAIARIELPHGVHLDSSMREYIGRALYDELLAAAPEPLAKLARRR